MDEKSNNYYHTKESVDEYINLAKDANGAELIEKLKNYLKPGSSLLEIGSGPGSDFQILEKDFDVIGSDYSNEFIDHLRNSHPGKEFLLLDAILLKTELKFDGIYSNKVLQHINDEELKKSILNQTQVLNSKGVVCHSFWKGEGDEVFKGLLVNYQTDESLREFFEKEFEILVLEEYKEFENGDSILLIAKKKG